MLAIGNGARHASRKRDFKGQTFLFSSCLITFSFLSCSHSSPFSSYRSLPFLLFLLCSPPRSSSLSSSLPLSHFIILVSSSVYHLFLAFFSSISDPPLVNVPDEWRDTYTTRPAGEISLQKSILSPSWETCGILRRLPVYIR